MAKFDTKHLHAMLTMASESPIPDVLPLIQAYHQARFADALERIAKQLEDGQIATLEGGNIAAALNTISKKLEAEK